MRRPPGDWAMTTLTRECGRVVRMERKHARLASRRRGDRLIIGELEPLDRSTGSACTARSTRPTTTTKIRPSARPRLGRSSSAVVGASSSGSGGVAQLTRCMSFE